MRRTSWILCLAFAFHLAGWFVVIPVHASMNVPSSAPVSSCHRQTTTPADSSSSTTACLSHCLLQDYDTSSQTEGLLNLSPNVQTFLVASNNFSVSSSSCDDLFADAIPPPLSISSQHLTIQKRE